jgi:putative peptidoglycan lipid II flippase
MAPGSTVKNVAIVAGTTVVSRLFGFLRDVACFSFLGAAEMLGAFLLAFSIPNMFRRLLGEGALSSAIIPILSRQYVAHGRMAMFGLFNRIVLRLLVVFGGVILLAYGAVVAGEWLAADAKWKLALGFTALLLPYMAFVCLAAVVSAALNVLDRFFIPAVNQVWMNLAMILSLLIGGHCFELRGLPLVHCLIGGVLAGGLLQLSMPLATMFVLGWRPMVRCEIPGASAAMAVLWRTFLPGLAGACIEQVNILVSRVIAYCFAASAVPLLYLAARLAELPSGVFGVAIVTVFFPNMAKIIGGARPWEEASAAFNSCLVALLWIMLPSAIGLFALKREILLVFFQHGNFTAAEVARVLPIVAIHCVGLPFSCAAALFVRGFHSLGDMKTPAIVGGFALAINAALALALGRSHGICGIATATTAATVLQTLCLATLLSGRIPGLSMVARIGDLCTIFSGSVAVFAIATATTYLHSPDSRGESALAIVIAVVLSASAYLAISRKLLARALAVGRIGGKDRR